MSNFGRRHDYSQGELDETSINADPFTQFRDWFDTASSDDRVTEPNAMTVATVAPDGRPAARIVLLRGVDDTGFVFYTNYDSAKGRALATTPSAALVFFWPAQERQIRIEGSVERVGAAESDEYFASRPYKSRLGALASDQSRVISGRDVLEARMAELIEQYPEGSVIPRPQNWGGLRVIPDTIEFWQGRRSRLHDRIVYRRSAANDPDWTIERLAP